jgi:integrase
MKPTNDGAGRHVDAPAAVQRWVAAGVDVVMISRRLGHKNPTVTLNVYAHLFKPDDKAAAAAIERAMRGKPRTS